MAYQKNDPIWQSGTSITADRMNHIEDGLVTAAQNADSALSNSTTSSGVASEARQIASRAEGKANDALTMAAGQSESSRLGGWAWSQLRNAGVEADAAGVVSVSLANILNTLRDADSNLRAEDEHLTDSIDGINSALTNAAHTAVANNLTNAEIMTVAERIGALYREINVTRSMATDTSSYFDVNNPFNVIARLNKIDGNPDSTASMPTRTLQNVIDELANARVSTVNRTPGANPGDEDTDTTYASVDARFESAESNILNLLTEITAAHESTAFNKISDNAYGSIDARFEAIENEIVGARSGSVSIDARLDAIDDTTTNGTLIKRVSSLETTTGSLNTNLGTVEGRVTAAETAISNMDAAYKAADTAINTAIGLTENDGLRGRITALEAEVDMASTDGERRLDDIEERLDAIDDASTGTVAGLDTRVAALETTVDTATTGLTDRVSTLESTVGDNTTGLAATKAIADGAASAASGLATRVTVLEGKDTIVVEAPLSGSNYTNGEPNLTAVPDPSENADYLIADDDGKYFYWRYINNNWELISGAGGGGGTSSAEFYADLTDIEGTPSDTVDYFIGTGTHYIHYRYKNNNWVQILPDHLINSVTVDTSTVGEGENPPTKSRPIIKEIGSETNLLANFKAVQSFDAEAVENGYKLTWVDIDGELRDITITGGGGGSSSGINASIDRITNSNITTIAGESCEISYTYNATEPDGTIYETTGQGTWSINGARVASQEVSVGNNTFNIAPYLNTGTNNIALSVTITADGQNITRTKTWVANVINFSLVWNYEESTINSGSVINFSCVPYGTDITKTLYLKVGAHEQTQTVTTSGIPTTVALQNNFSHGNYTAEMWMTATINGVEKTTPHILHDFIVVQQGNNTPIIAATLPSSSIDQYDTISIPFVVYTPNSSLSTITLTANSVVQDTRSDVGRTTQTWNYTPSTLGTDIVYDNSTTPPTPISGTHTLTITSGTATKTLTLTVNSISINNSEIGGYAFKLKASELPSNNALQNWQYDNNDNSTKIQFSNNFDWINGGIQTERDENNQLRQYIRIKPGTTMTIPYKMFATDPRINGSNFKIIFKVENCRNYDAIIATTVADNIGIQLNAHNAVFKSTTTQVSTQYGENEYTELEFEVYKNHLTGGVDAPNPYMMAWIDGVMTSARPYDGNFVQTSANAKNIVIGSNDCDVCVYLVKYYPAVLSIADHISNFIADAPNAAEMIRRYNRNDILDNDGDISFNKLADKNRDCRVWLYKVPRMTTGKKDYIAGVEFQQIYKNGTAYQDGLHGKGTLTVQGTSSVNYRKGAANTDINFYDTKDGRIASCELYDGEGHDLLYDTINGENVAKPVSERGYKINTDSTPITYSNMKVNFASCEQVNNMCNAEWYQQFQPYPSLSTRDCMEFAMGVQFILDQGLNEPSGEVILFNEKSPRNANKYYMYSIGNLGTSKKNTHIFHNDNECCVEVMNNQNAGCRMVSVPSDLEADYTAYQNEDYASMTNYDWGGSNEAKDHSYEMRFPDTKNPAKEIKAGWARFVKWMADNNPSAATGNTLATEETYGPYTFKGHAREGLQVLRGTVVNQYAGTYTTDTFERRMAKMLSECEDYMAMDSVIYHFLFIERHTMVDNVSKNTFWSAAKTNQYINGVEQEDTEGYWIWDLSKNYDNDTSDGNNNEGQLIFDYGNEANDRQDGKAIFNASDAVWFVFASNLYEACQAMFQNRESATSKNGRWQNAWNASAYHNYLLSEQRKVPERVWNECYWYDYLRTFETGKVYNEETDKDTQIIDKSWITFLDGGQKTHQRKHYETFEELYDASKYRSNFSTANSITLRGYTPDPGDPSLLAVPAKSEIAVKMYNKCYLTAHFDNNIETKKAARGELVTLKFLEPNGEYMNLSDTVIKIDTASMIQEIGDLAPLYPGQASFSAASRLRSIKIGDSTEGYNNPHITNTETGTVDFGANYMLEHLEVQNLSNANQPLNLTGCPALSYLNASGSSFTGITFANGGLLTEAYVNNPTNLIMRNLDLLTLSNFHITSPTSVTQLRLEGCVLFDKQTFVESLTNLNVIRLAGINWSLSNSTLLDNLLGIMGMDELGYTISQSYLAGSVSLLGTVYEGKYNAYVSAWSPDLSIDVTHASPFIQQHLVTYKDESGNTIYSQYINHGDPIIDPYSSNLLDEMPAKAPDVENRYIFGSLNNMEQYIPYSGWRISTDSESMYDTYPNTYSEQLVNGEITLYTVFSPIKQRYTVRWLVRENQVVYETPAPQNYGSGYDLKIPTIKDIQSKGYNTYEFSSSGNNCTYRIINGWNKSPANIAPTQVGSTYDIYATWLERTNVNYNTVLTSSDYSVAEKLLVLKEMAGARSSLSIRDIFPVQMGYDGMKPAIDLINTPTVYTGTTEVKNYTPFAVNKSFTLVIDYKFEPQTSSIANEAVLASCYETIGNSGQGFKLFYNPKAASPVPQISFGDTSISNSSSIIKTIGKNINTRNIIVLRHLANDPILYIYCGSNADGLVNDYNILPFRQTINWSTLTTDAKLVFGGMQTNSGSSIINASGTIYSAKYWEEDLGEGECLQLASWCHETMNFAIQDFDGYSGQHNALNGVLNAKVVLNTLNASEMGKVIEPVIDKNNKPQYVGWETSNIRTFYNNRLYQGLPILLQSVMHTVTVPYIRANFDSINGGYQIATSDNNSQDYVFAPTSIEAGAQGNTVSSHSMEALRAFPWYKASEITVMQFNGATFNAISGNAEYTNIRFPYFINKVNSEIKIYIDYPSTNQSFYTWANNNSITLNPGDILIPQNSSYAYIYVSASDVRNGAPIVNSTSGGCLSGAIGGWVQSIGWWTRSVPDINTNLNAVIFSYITELGALVQGRQDNGLGLSYSIAI